MRSITLGRRTEQFFLSAYLFILFFQPPITPISQIYLTGIITFVLLALEGKRSVESVIRRTQAGKLLVALVLMSAYLWVVSMVNVLLIDQRDLFINRLRCFNQLAVLTFIQVSGVLFTLIRAEKMHLSMRELLQMAVLAGVMQGICAIGAYYLPELRRLFLQNADTVYQNEWLLERRGYGFSATLLDTFGYGIGIIGAILLCVPFKSKIVNILAAALLIFTAFFNSRTGIVVLLFAVIVKSCLSGKGFSRIVYLAVTLISLSVIYMHLPDIIQVGSQSASYTVRWVTSALNDFYSVLHNEMSVGDAQFVSGLISFSNNDFELLFGSGHSVYGTRPVLGFATDIGYYNLIWIYGVVGTLAIYAFFINLSIKAYRLCQSNQVRILVVIAVTTFFLVQFKCNVLGASPGICATYLILYSVFFYQGQLDESDNEVIHFG